MRREILEGLELVRHHRVLFPIVMRSVVAHVAGAFYGVLYTIYLIDDLHLDPFLLGIVVSVGGVGSLVGSFFAAPAIRRLSIGPALVGAAGAARRDPDTVGPGTAAPRHGDGADPPLSAMDSRPSKASPVVADPGLSEMDPRPNERHVGVLARIAYPTGALAAAGWRG
jgi:hypothetical protein